MNFEISKSTYFRLIKINYDKDLNDYKIIKKMFIKHKEKVGIRQLKMLIERDSGIIFNNKKIARIKRKFNLKTKIRRKNKFRLFIKKNQEHKIFPNLLDRKFDQIKPDKVYSIDITQINYGHKKLYVAALKDLCTKEIVGKSISNRIDLKLTNTALDKALIRLTVEEKKNLMIHSDQGFHFTHFSYLEKLRVNGVTQSMSRKGNCIDNAPIESFCGHLKDLIDVSECKKYDDLKSEVTKQINYYNHRRPQLGIKKMPPSEYRRHLKL